MLYKIVKYTAFYQVFLQKCVSIFHYVFRISLKMSVIQAYGGFWFLFLYSNALMFIWLVTVMEMTLKMLQSSELTMEKCLE